MYVVYNCIDNQWYCKDNTMIQIGRKEMNIRDAHFKFFTIKWINKLELESSSNGSRHKLLLQCPTCYEYLNFINLIEHEQNRRSDCAISYHDILNINKVRMEYSNSLNESSSDNDDSEEKELETTKGTDANYSKQSNILIASKKRKIKRKKKTKNDNQKEESFDEQFRKWMISYQVESKFNKIMTVMNVPETLHENVAVRLIDFICDC